MRKVYMSHQRSREVAKAPHATGQASRSVPSGSGCHTAVDIQPEGLSPHLRKAVSGAPLFFHLKMAIRAMPDDRSYYYV